MHSLRCRIRARSCVHAPTRTCVTLGGGYNAHPPRVDDCPCPVRARFALNNRVKRFHAANHRDTFPWFLLTTTFVPRGVRFSSEFSRSTIFLLLLSLFPSRCLSSSSSFLERSFKRRFLGVLGEFVGESNLCKSGLFHFSKELRL